MNATLEIPIVPRRLVFEPEPPLTDEEFEKLCFANDLFQLERTREGKIVVNPPATGFTGDANREIIHQLSVWWHRHKQGRAFDNNTGFFLPDGSMFTPDAAYIRREKSRRITQEEGGHLLRVVPDFVVELLSPSDTLAKTKRKMETWISNGVELGWLVDPYKKQVLVYEPGKPMSTESGDFVEGTGPVHGLRLDLNEIWQRYEQEE